MRVRFSPLSGIVLALLLGGAPEAFAEPPLRVHFFDVGQGDAVLVESPSGQTLVYDGGPSAAGMLQRLETLGTTTVDLVIASHNHADHIGGLPEVVRRYGPRFYLDNGFPATTLTYQRILEAVESAGSRLLEPTERRISLGEVTVQVLPLPGVGGWGQNDNSVGVVIEYGRFRLSLAGDAERRQWAWWMRHHGDLLGPVQVHKASHHGSRNGDTPAAIDLLSPEVVVIGVGGRNRYGHPHPDTLRLYSSRGAKVYRTDLHGTILIEAEPTGRYSVLVERGQGARPPPPEGPVAAQAVPDRHNCIDLNSASPEELQRIIHIGPARAREIVNLRSRQPFRSTRDLTRVGGIGPARLSDIVAERLACVKP